MLLLNYIFIYKKLINYHFIIYITYCLSKYYVSSFVISGLWLVLHLQLIIMQALFKAITSKLHF